MLVPSPYNVLFSAAGRRVSLLRHFRKTLADLGLVGEVLAVDSGKTAPAAFVADRMLRVPLMSDPAYIDAMLAVCRENRVHLLFPLIDTDIGLLAQHRHRFAEIGTTVVVSSAATVDICFDKNRTYDFFRSHDIDTPVVYPPSALQDPQALMFPLLIKPYDGSSGVGVTKIRDEGELRFFAHYVEHAMVQEFVRGQEYTVDVLVGPDGRVGCVVPRMRIEVRGGEVSKGLTVKSPTIITAARRVVEQLPGALGCITVQCFQQPDGRIRFIEINPRFGGGFPLSLHAGADFPRWIIEQDLHRGPTQYRDDWIDDLAMLRYDDEIIVKGDRIR